MTRFKIILLLFFAFAKANSVHAQSENVKLEREQRVDSSLFTVSALSLVQEIAVDRKVKFYKEFDGDKTSLEAKFKKRRQRYSIEFSLDGTLEDVEIEVKRKDIDLLLWKKIKIQLDSVSDQWRVEKMQQQYVSNPFNKEGLLLKIEEKEFDNLELIVAFKSNRKIYRKELLFNTEGEIINQRNVNRLAYDFLLF
jgi:hypothetical protein